MPSEDPKSRETLALLKRFNDVFLNHDPRALDDLVAEDCCIENTQRAPDGSRHEGKDACVSLWTRIATAAGTRFEPESVTAYGERGIILWRLRWGDSPKESVRGANIMRVRDGRIIEALGYVKGS